MWWISLSVSTHVISTCNCLIKNLSNDADCVYCSSRCSMMRRSWWSVPGWRQTSSVRPSGLSWPVSTTTRSRCFWSSSSVTCLKGQYRPLGPVSIQLSWWMHVLHSLDFIELLLIITSFLWAIRWPITSGLLTSGQGLDVAHSAGFSCQWPEKQDWNLIEHFLEHLCAGVKKGPKTHSGGHVMHRVLCCAPLFFFFLEQRVAGSGWV